MLAPIRISIVLFILLGGIYPGVTTVVAQVAFPRQAQGSIVYDASGKAIGSELIAQAFDKDQYFHPRPSAAGTCTR